MIDTINAIRHFKKKLNKSNNMGKLVNQDVIRNEKLEDEISIEELKFICIQINRKGYPTIDLIREELIDGISRICSSYTIGRGYLSHDCCFTENLNPIIELIKRVVNRKYLMEKLINAKE